MGLHGRGLILFALALFAAGPLAIAQDRAKQPTEQDAATCEAVTGNIDASIEACTRLLDAEIRASARRQALALTLRALGWKAKGGIQPAAIDLTAAIGLDETFAPAYETRADLLRDNDQCDLAIPDYDQAIKLSPERAPTYVNRSLCLIDRKEPDRAVADLDQVIRIDADNKAGLAVLAMNLKAGVEVGKGELDRAIASYEAAIKLDPKRAAFYADRGRAWAIKGDPDKALADFDQAIKLDPNNTDGYAVGARVLKARLQASRGNPDAAIAEYDEALKLAPKQVALYVSRAGQWNLKGDAERAMADYDEAIKVDPKDATAYTARGDLHRSKGDYDRAIADYDQAIERQPDDLTAYGNRGLVRFYSGTFNKAAEDFKRVADAQVNAYPALMLYLSRTREGDGRDAKSDLTKTAGKLKAGDWPQPIVELYLGKKSASATEGAAKTAEQKCEVQFYIGEWHLTRKDRSEAIKALQAAIDSCPKDFVEYRAAVDELKRVK